MVTWGFKSWVKLILKRQSNSKLENKIKPQEKYFMIQSELTTRVMKYLRTGEIVALEISPYLIPKLPYIFLFFWRPSMVYIFYTM